MAQDTNGVAPLEIREYDTRKIDELKESGDFDYVETPPENPSLISRIWEYIRDFIDAIFGAATDTTTGRILTYIGGFILILVAIVKLFGINVRDIIYSTSDKRKTSFEFLEDDIHSLDFEKLLVEALQKEDFRLAIRLTYLKTLKHLSDGLIVEWVAGKTNYDYLYEISNDELRAHFGELSYLFDYAWYGDFEINESTYLKAQKTAGTITSSTNTSIPQAV